MKKKIIPVIAAFVLIIITIVATYGMKIIEKYSYSKERADLFEYFNKNSMHELLGNSRL